jgi:hypothetical protein
MANKPLQSRSNHQSLPVNVLAVLTFAGWCGLQDFFQRKKHSQFFHRHAAMPACQGWVCFLVPAGHDLANGMRAISKKKTNVGNFAWKCQLFAMSFGLETMTPRVLSFAMRSNLLQSAEYLTFRCRPSILLYRVIDFADLLQKRQRGTEVGELPCGSTNIFTPLVLVPSSISHPVYSPDLQCYQVSLAKSYAGLPTTHVSQVMGNTSLHADSIFKDHYFSDSYHD